LSAGFSILALTVLNFEAYRKLRRRNLSQVYPVVPWTCSSNIYYQHNQGRLVEVSKLVTSKYLLEMVNITLPPN
jgi:hypothetical protein